MTQASVYLEGTSQATALPLWHEILSAIFGARIFSLPQLLHNGTQCFKKFQIGRRQKPFYVRFPKLLPQQGHSLSSRFRSLYPYQFFNAVPQFSQCVLSQLGLQTSFRSLKFQWS